MCTQTVKETHTHIRNPPSGECLILLLFFIVKPLCPHDSQRVTAWGGGADEPVHSHTEHRTQAQARTHRDGRRQTQTHASEAHRHTQWPSRLIMIPLTGLPLQLCLVHVDYSKSDCSCTHSRRRFISSSILANSLA